MLLRMLVREHDEDDINRTSCERDMLKNESVTKQLTHFQLESSTRVVSTLSTRVHSLPTQPRVTLTNHSNTR